MYAYTILLLDSRCNFLHYFDSDDMKFGRPPLDLGPKSILDFSNPIQKTRSRSTSKASYCVVSILQYISAFNLAGRRCVKRIVKKFFLKFTVYIVQGETKRNEPTFASDAITTGAGGSNFLKKKTHRLTIRCFLTCPRYRAKQVRFVGFVRGQITVKRNCYSFVIYEYDGMVTVIVHHSVESFIFVVVFFWCRQRRKDIEGLVIDKRHLAGKTNKQTSELTFGRSKTIIRV